MRFRPFHTILFLLLILASAASSVWAGEPHNRNGFLIGFGLGAGTVEVEANNVTSDRESGNAGNFRVGWAVTPAIALALEGSAFIYQEEVLYEDVTFTFSATTIALTFYPGEAGFYVRGGFGVGSMKMDVEVAGASVSYEEDGVSFLGALGYEWRLTNKFALGPQVEYAAISIDDGVLDSANYFDGSLQLTWYW